MIGNRIIEDSLKGHIWSLWDDCDIIMISRDTQGMLHIGVWAVRQLHWSTRVDVDVILFFPMPVAFVLLVPPWKMNGWNLQITHEKKGKWSSFHFHDYVYVPAVNLQGYISHISIYLLSNVVCNSDWPDDVTLPKAKQPFSRKRHKKSLHELVFPKISLVNIEAYKCLWVPRCWLCEDSTKIVGCDARLRCFLHHLAIKLSPATWCCVFFFGGGSQEEWIYGTVLPSFFFDNVWYQKCKMETEKKALGKARRMLLEILISEFPC